MGLKENLAHRRLGHIQTRPGTRDYFSCSCDKSMANKLVGLWEKLAMKSWSKEKAAGGWVCGWKASLAKKVVSFLGGNGLMWSCFVKMNGGLGSLKMRLVGLAGTETVNGICDEILNLWKIKIFTFCSDEMAKKPYCDFTFYSAWGVFEWKLVY